MDAKAFLANLKQVSTCYPGLAIYVHDGCRDGNLALFLMRKYIAAKMPHWSVTVVGVSYANTPAVAPIVFDGPIMFIDCCDAQALDHLHPVFVIDHHQSSVDIVAKLGVDKQAILFSTEWSASMLIWMNLCADIFDADTERVLAEMVKYVDEYDTQKNPRSAESDLFALVTESISPDVYVTWTLDELADRLNRRQLELDARNRLIAEIASTASHDVLDNNVLAMVVNASAYEYGVITPLGQYLLAANPQVDVVFIVTGMKDSQVSFSLRSRMRPDKSPSFDCQHFARPYGGGGHVCAAGMKCALTESPVNI